MKPKTNKGEQQRVRLNSDIPLFVPCIGPACHQKVPGLALSPPALCYQVIPYKCIVLFCFCFCFPFSLEQSPAVLAQLQRVYVITPDQPEAILLNPRVQVWFATPPPQCNPFFFS